MSSKDPIGQLNKRIKVQKPVQVPDDRGGVMDDWQTVATVWASIRPKKGMERLKALGIESPTTHEIVVRYRKDIQDSNNRWRLQYGRRVFNIRETLNVEERNRFLQLQAEEHVGS